MLQPINHQENLSAEVYHIGYLHWLGRKAKLEYANG